MKKYQQGFSAVELILIIVVLGLVVAVGWLVYDRQDSKDTETNDESSSEVEQKTEQETTAQSASYQLPEGWLETTCDSVDSKAVLASPNSDVALDCDDRTNSILVSMYDAGKEACLSSTEVEQVAQNKPISGYECEEIVVDGVEVVKETADYGGGPTISYSFVGKPIIVAYYSDENGELSNAYAVDMLVQSVKF